MSKQSKASNNNTILLALCLLLGFYGIVLRKDLPQYQAAVAVVSTEKEPGNDGHSKHKVEMEFDWINKRLVGPPISSTDFGVNEVDYPSWYTVEDIQQSVDFMDEHFEVIEPFANHLLKNRAREAEMQCGNVDGEKSRMALDRGGWCLVEGRTKSSVLYNTSIVVAENHVKASARIVEELSTLIVQENITSINDFGAGVGQYKAEILRKFPNFDYRAFDGAGNVVEYTTGFLKYFDLTYPLALPKADWVLSLEVGEHIPSQHEGMLLRNLHRHNTKGIILSWGILRQGGHSHINNHSNEYVIKMMESLGYTIDIPLGQKFRKKQDNYPWFEKSVMVFRRK